MVIYDPCKKAFHLVPQAMLYYHSSPQENEASLSRHDNRTSLELLMKAYYPSDSEKIARARNLDSRAYAITQTYTQFPLSKNAVKRRIQKVRALLKDLFDFATNWNDSISDEEILCYQEYFYSLICHACYAFKETEGIKELANNEKIDPLKQRNVELYLTNLYYSPYTAMLIHNKYSTEFHFENKTRYCLATSFSRFKNASKNNILEFSTRENFEYLLTCIPHISRAIIILEYKLGQSIVHNKSSRIPYAFKEATDKVTLLKAYCIEVLCNLLAACIAPSLFWNILEDSVYNNKSKTCSRNPLHVSKRPVLS